MLEYNWENINQAGVGGVGVGSRGVFDDGSVN